MDKSSKIGGYEMFAIHMLYFGATASFIYPSFLMRSTLGSYWIPIVVWGTMALFASWLYSRMLSQFHGEGLLAELKRCLGPVATGLICLPIFIYLILALVIMLRSYTEIITMTLLPTTPTGFLNGMILAPALLASAGVMPIVRSARVFALFVVPLSIVLLLLGLSDLNWTLGIPWARTNGDFLASNHFYAGSFLWMGFVVTALIKPYSQKSAVVAWRAYGVALLCALPMIASYIYLPVLTFGRELSRQLTVPFVSKMDSVYHYWVIVENLGAIFVSMSLLYVLIIMALKLHALGNAMQTFVLARSNRLLYAVVSIIVLVAATVLPSWRDLELVMGLTAGLRLYVMFVFPLLVKGLLHATRRRSHAELET